MKPTLILFTLTIISILMYQINPIVSMLLILVTALISVVHLAHSVRYLGDRKHKV